ncbi:MAG: mechanosensitive ion channel [Acidobacteriota bacterium]|nr:mechanosensitive ion channel [Acidobacteriota bacterium]
MNIMGWLTDAVIRMVPLTAVLLVGGGALWFLNRRMVRKAAEISGEGTFRRQLLLSLLSGIFLVAVIIAAPLNPDDTHDLITLFGVAVTGVIALSSTTLASNAMAGVMLRLVRNFKRGDYIRVGEYLGRVTERGLFHTEIQNERSDLTTLPNQYLVSNGVTVIRPSGTFISATVSLGYDLQHDEIEDLLCAATERAGLLEPFVRIRALGDFSVTYEVSGKLGDTKTFLGSKSALHRSVLDTLHGAGVEIVSPTFENQRRVSAGEKFVPDIDEERAADPKRDQGPDTLVFDKADQVERVEDLRHRLSELDAELADLGTQLKAAAEGEGEKLEETIALRKKIRERLVKRIAELEAAVKD